MGHCSWQSASDFAGSQVVARASDINPTHAPSSSATASSRGRGDRAAAIAITSPILSPMCA